MSVSSFLTNERFTTGVIAPLSSSLLATINHNSCNTSNNCHRNEITPTGIFLFLESSFFNQMTKLNQYNCVYEYKDSSGFSSLFSETVAADSLKCGSCLSEFLLSDIVIFIQHKTKQCKGSGWPHNFLLQL
jgi:hypothetical protein